MKKIVLLTLVFLFVNNVFAQPNITKSLFIKSKICSQEDKGLRNKVVLGNLVCGASIVLNKKSFSSSADGGLVIMNSNFDTLRNYSFGGSGEDFFEHIDLLSNGHLLLSGTTQSKDMDLAGIGHSYTAEEIWLVELDTNGHIFRSKTFGGANGSQLFSTCVSSNGFIYTCGATIANDYDFYHAWPSSGNDGWVAKLDTSFNLVWVKMYAGNLEDDCMGIHELNNNRYYISIITSSTDSLMAGAQAIGFQDLLVVYIDSAGNEIWKKRIGGTGIDAIQMTIIDKPSGMLYGAGTTTSSGGSLTYRTGTYLSWPPYNYNRNIWVVKIDTNGNLLQSKAYGDKINGVDGVEAIGFYSNHFYVASTNLNGGGDLESSDPPIDDTIRNTWIGILDTNLYLVGKYVARTNCGAPGINSFLNFGSEFYAFGKITVCDYNLYNYFSCDTTHEFQYILHISDSPLSTNEIHEEETPFTIYPNPTDNSISIIFDNHDIVHTIYITNLNGGVVFKKKAINNIEISTHLWSSGTYIVNIQQNNNTHSQTFIKN